MNIQTNTFSIHEIIIWKLNSTAQSRRQAEIIYKYIVYSRGIQISNCNYRGIIGLVMEMGGHFLPGLLMRGWKLVSGPWERSFEYLCFTVYIVDISYICVYAHTVIHRTLIFTIIQYLSASVGGPWSIAFINIYLAWTLLSGFQNAVIENHVCCFKWCCLLAQYIIFSLRWLVYGM